MGNPIAGAMDQIRIFNSALDAAEIQYIHTYETDTTAAELNPSSWSGNVPATCVAAYQLDGDASDLSGNYGGVTTTIRYTGLRFQPDFVWLKSRDSSGQWYTITDSVRGATNYLYTNDVNTQDTSAGSVTAFTSQGFTVGNENGFNASGSNYVAWCLKAGGKDGVK